MKEKIQLAMVSDFDKQAIVLSAAAVNIGLIFFLYQLQCHVFWKDANKIILLYTEQNATFVP